MRDRLKTAADDRDGMIVMTTAMVMMAVVVDFFYRQLARNRFSRKTTQRWQKKKWANIRSSSLSSLPMSHLLKTSSIPPPPFF
jgi:hypothetical protein